MPAPSSTSPPSPPSPSRRNVLRRVADSKFLASPQLNGIVAVLGVLVAAAAVYVSVGGDGDEGGEPAAVRAGGDVEVADCAAVGSGNELNCTIVSAESVPSKVVMTAHDETMWFFEGAATDLPRPPPYTSATWHCGEWMAWLQGDERFLQAPGAAYVELETASPTGSVVVHTIRVNVWERRSLDLRNLTPVVCNHGAGGIPGFFAHVDTVASTTVLTVNEAASPFDDRPMPPASVKLGGKEATNGIVNVTSKPGYAYTGQIVLDVTVDGEERKVTVGTREQPMRWYQFPGDDPGPAYDWDAAKQAWVQNFQPFGE